MKKHTSLLSFGDDNDDGDQDVVEQESSKPALVFQGGKKRMRQKKKEKLFDAQQRSLFILSTPAPNGNAPKTC